MKIILSAFIIIIFSIPYQLLAESYCGSLRNGFGPFDYSNPAHRNTDLTLVEDYHFTKNVENLIAGNSGPIGGDIDYTLRAYPNHYRALTAMSKLAIREKTIKPRGAKYTILCYFERAIRFKPDDAIVRSLYGGHLLKTGQSDMAMEQLIIATKIEPDNPTFNYNLGLLYFDKKNYTKAKKYANKAYSQDFPMPGLKNKLKSVGKW